MAPAAYSALRKDEVQDSYELDEARHRSSLSDLLMPRSVHRMLNAYLKGDETLDSDSDEEDQDNISSEDEKQSVMGKENLRQLSSRRKGRHQNTDVEALSQSPPQENTLKVGVYLSRDGIY